MTKVNALSAHPRMYRQVSRIFFLSISCKKWTKEHEERSPTRSPRPRAGHGSAALLRMLSEELPDRIPLPLGLRKKRLPLLTKGRLFAGDRRSPLRTAGQFHRRGELCSPATNVILSASEEFPQSRGLLRKSETRLPAARFTGETPFPLYTPSALRGGFFSCHSERMRRIPWMIAHIEASLA